MCPDVFSAYSVLNLNRMINGSRMLTNLYSQLAVPEVGTAAYNGQSLEMLAHSLFPKLLVRGEKTHDCDISLSLLVSIFLPFSPPPLLPSVLSSFLFHSLLLRFPKSLSHQLLFPNLSFSNALSTCESVRNV